MHAKELILIGAATAALLGTANAAQAQGIGDSIIAGPASTNFARDRNISVRQRPRAEYEALGIHLGGFMAYPRIMGTAEYDDNVFALETNKRSDTIFRLQPEFTVTSNWSRHAVSVYGRSTLTRYDKFKSENSDEWMLGGTGRLDIQRDTTLSAAADFARLTEPRTVTSTQVQSVVPVQYDQGQANLVLVKEFNRLRVTARGDLRHYNYHDGRTELGASVDEDFRDHDELTGTVRADYALTPATAFFVQGALNKHNYDLKGSPTVLDRDSDGVEVLAGANFELSNLVRGDIGVGYVQQSYNSAAFRDIKGIGARGQLEWFPSQLTTVGITAARRIQDSGIPGAAGYLSTSLAAQVDHELLRNLILTGQASFGNDRYRGLDRRDKYYRIGVSGTYLLNRNVGLTLGYSYYNQNSSGAASGPDYKVNKVGATLTLQY